MCRSRGRIIAAFLTAGLLLPACGTRLTPAEVRALRQQPPGAEPAPVDDGLASSAAGEGEAGVRQTRTTQTRRAGTGTRSGPADCRGAATDTGVTETTILTGGSVAVRPIPRQFTPAAEGVTSYFKMVNAAGGVCGRRLEYRSYDDQLNTSGYLDNMRRLVESDKVFSLVGSMSAADSGACGYMNAHQNVPDVGTFALSTCRALAPNFYSPMGSVRPDLYGGTTQWRWLIERYPYRRPAALWVNQSVSREQGVAVTDGLVRTLRETGAVGNADRSSVLQQEHPLVGANFDLAVVQMRENGVDAVWSSMDIDNNRSLLAAICRADWKPRLVHFEISVYDPQFFDKVNNDACVNGQNVWLRAPHMPFGHSDNAEVALYVKTLKAYFPNSTPSTFGLEGWLTGKLFVEVLSRLGPNVTRARLMEALNDVRDWTGGGAIGPNTPAERYIYLCNIMLRVANRDFVPHSGFLCGPLYKVGDHTGPPVREPKGA